MAVIYNKYNFKLIIMHQLHHFTRKKMKALLLLTIILEVVLTQSCSNPAALYQNPFSDYIRSSVGISIHAYLTNSGIVTINLSYWSFFGNHDLTNCAPTECYLLDTSNTFI